MKPFLEEFEQKQREERDRINFHAYMVGVYVRDAIAACLGKNQKYPEMPYDLRTQREKDTAITSEEYTRRLVLMNEYNDKERKLAERRKEGG